MTVMTTTLGETFSATSTKARFNWRARSRLGEAGATPVTRRPNQRARSARGFILGDNLICPRRYALRRALATKSWPGDCLEVVGRFGGARFLTRRLPSTLAQA